MKVYLCADIEGSCGFTSHEEGTVGTPLYNYFKREMALEVAAACRGIKKAGGDVLVHDSHATARNIDHTLLPSGVELMRCSGGDPYAMMSGLHLGGFDAAVMTGFHAGAGSAGSPVSHTFNHKTSAIYLNGMRLSEFLFDAYTASYLGVPVPFISGDSEICAFAKDLIPSITTVEAVTGIGSGTRSRHPDEVQQEIEEKIEMAFKGNWRECIVPLPDSFTMTMHFHSHKDAYFNSFYTGITQLDDCALEYKTNDWFEVLRMVHFVLDK